MRKNQQTTLMDTKFSRITVFDDVLSDVLLDGVSIPFQSHKMQSKYQSLRKLFPLPGIKALLEKYVTGMLDIETVCLLFMVMGYDSSGKDKGKGKDGKRKGKVGSTNIVGEIREAILLCVHKKRLSSNNNNAIFSDDNWEQDITRQFGCNSWIGSYVNFMRDSETIIEFYDHIKMYISMYDPNAGFQITPTARYRHLTGKQEAAVVSTRRWNIGQEIRLLRGKNIYLSDEQEAFLNSHKRDFSVLYSSRKKCYCLFLGPARFVNHDCKSNCKYEPMGTDYVCLKVVKPIEIGDEITSFYGDNYFGPNNQDCLCRSCESSSSEKENFSVNHSDSSEFVIPRKTRKGNTSNNTLSSSSETAKIITKISESSFLNLYHKFANKNFYLDHGFYMGSRVPSPFSHLSESGGSKAEFKCKVCDGVRQEVYCVNPKICPLTGEPICESCYLHVWLYGIPWPKRSREEKDAAVAAIAAASTLMEDNVPLEMSMAIIENIRKVVPELYDGCREDYEDHFNQNSSQAMQERVEIGGPFAVLFWDNEDNRWKPAVRIPREEVTLISDDDNMVEIKLFENWEIMMVSESQLRIFDPFCQPMAGILFQMAKGLISISSIEPYKRAMDFLERGRLPKFSIHWKGWGKSPRWIEQYRLLMPHEDPFCEIYETIGHLGDLSSVTPDSEFQWIEMRANEKFDVKILQVSDMGKMTGVLEKAVVPSIIMSSSCAEHRRKCHHLSSVIVKLHFKGCGESHNTWAYAVDLIRKRQEPRFSLDRMIRFYGGDVNWMKV